ncbi:LacI family transcriptional regulator [Alicyclobacillus sacchari]|nr:LacI family transcriptional regulator [Alicyclobacillus sacchari]
MATRVDVAKRAGVSPTTVSRVLNDNGYVAQDVRERVLKAIEELQYVPNRVARSLKMKRCGQFACVISSLSNPFYHEVLMGIEDAALQRGYTFSLYNMTQEKQGYMKLILEGFYDGLVFLTPYELMKVVDLVDLAKRIPLCAYQDRSIDLGVHAVAVDLYTAMKRNVQYLIGLGHRRIVFLGYEFERAEENPRYMGYVDAMHEHGLEIDPALVQFVPNLKDTLTLGRQRILEVLNRSISFTAVAASNDLLAVGAMRALTEWG